MTEFKIGQVIKYRNRNRMGFFCRVGDKVLCFNFTLNGKRFSYNDITFDIDYDDFKEEDLKNPDNVYEKCDESSMWELWDAAFNQRIR